MTSSANSLDRINNNDFKYFNTNKFKVKSLQLSCFKVIRKSLGILRINQVEQLPLPRLLCDSLSELCLGDFFINPTHIMSEHHRNNIFQATCLIDDSTVHLRLHEKEESVSRVPTLITTFRCSEIVFAVHMPTVSIAEYLRTLRQKGDGGLCEGQLWKILNQLCLMAYTLPHFIVLFPTHVHFSTIEGLVYLPETDKDSPPNYRPIASVVKEIRIAVNALGQAFLLHPHGMNYVTRTNERLYVAPELLENRSRPVVSLQTDSTQLQSHVWTIGCIMAKFLEMGPPNTNGWVDPTTRDAKRGSLLFKYTGSIQDSQGMTNAQTTVSDATTSDQAIQTETVAKAENRILRFDEELNNLDSNKLLESIQTNTLTNSTQTTNDSRRNTIDDNFKNIRMPSCSNTDQQEELHSEPPNSQAHPKPPRNSSKRKYLKDLCTLIKRCINAEQADRPTLDDIIQICRVKSDPCSRPEESLDGKIHRNNNFL